MTAAHDSEGPAPLNPAPVDPAPVNPASTRAAPTRAASAERATAGRATTGGASAGRASAGRASAGRATAGRATARRASAGRASAEFAYAVRAELWKVATLPSLRWTAVLTWAATALLAFAAHGATPSGDPVLTALRWTQAGFLILGVLGAAQEYEPGGQIRATLLASPRRYRLVAAKTTALAAVSVVAAAPIALAPPAPIRLGQVVYLAGVTLVGAAAAMVTRNALAATTVSLTTYLIVCPLARDGAPGLASWLPDTGLLDPSRGTAAAVIWPTALTTVAAVVFRRRNA